MVTTFAALLPLAYDWPMARAAVRSLVPLAPSWVVGEDSESRSWTGFPFEPIPTREVYAWPELQPFRRVSMPWSRVAGPPMARETFERNVLSLHAHTSAEWLLSIDADEELLDPEKVRAACAANPGHVVTVDWLTVWKVIGDTALVVNHAEGGRIHFARQDRAAFEWGRKGSGPQVHSGARLLHWAWSRGTGDAVRQKLESWGHRDDFGGWSAREDFARKWEATTIENYRELRDWHPVHAGFYESLRAVPLAELRSVQP